jgi:MFS family permease
MMASPALGTDTPTTKAASKEDLTKDLEKDGNGSNQDLELDEKPSSDQPQTTLSEPPNLILSPSRNTSEKIIVQWEPNDPENPWNFSNSKKWFITAQLGLLAFMASLASSITAPANNAIAAYINVSHEASVLTISLFVLGFVFGPCIWGPVSEIWGRRWSMLPATFAMGVFSIGFAVSENAASVFITRFFMGFFGSAPVSNVSAALGDLWEPKQRGKAVVWYAVSVVGGPTLGPTIGAALTVNESLGWYVDASLTHSPVLANNPRHRRWTGYMLSIWTFATILLLYFFCPELYAPLLLSRKAARLRQQTGNQAFHHPHADIKISFTSIVTKHFTRPVRMLLTEPMVTCICCYASFVFALLYMTLEFFSIVFYEDRGWPLVVSTLPFCALFVGILCAVFVNLANLPRYRRAVEANGGRPVPEARLPPMILGSISFSAGLFLFGWTSDPKISWVPSVIAAGMIGAGFNIVFQSAINFLIDTYTLYAASAVSANTFLRSLMAAGLPLAARPMFRGMGVGPACSVLGGVAALAVPLPFVFMKFGARLRAKSKFAPPPGMGRPPGAVGPGGRAGGPPSGNVRT